MFLFGFMTIFMHRPVFVYMCFSVCMSIMYLMCMFICRSGLSLWRPRILWYLTGLKLNIYGNTLDHHIRVPFISTKLFP